MSFLTTFALKYLTFSLLSLLFILSHLFFFSSIFSENFVFQGVAFVHFPSFFLVAVLSLHAYCFRLFGFYNCKYVVGFYFPQRRLLFCLLAPVLLFLFAAAVNRISHIYWCPVFVQLHYVDLHLFLLNPCRFPVPLHYLVESFVISFVMHRHGQVQT